MLYKTKTFIIGMLGLFVSIGFALVCAYNLIVLQRNIAFNAACFAYGICYSVYFANELTED